MCPRPWGHGPCCPNPAQGTNNSCEHFRAAPIFWKFATRAVRYELVDLRFNTSEEGALHTGGIRSVRAVGRSHGRSVQVRRNQGSAVSKGEPKVFGRDQESHRLSRDIEDQEARLGEMAQSEVPEHFKLQQDQRLGAARVWMRVRTLFVGSRVQPAARRRLQSERTSIPTGGTPTWDRALYNNRKRILD